MIPSTVRRVAGTAPQSSSSVVSSLAAAIPLARSYRTSPHQRRYSSSKPSAPADDGSAPNNGSSNYASASSVPSSSEKRKRKAKDTTTPVTPVAPKLPSVPSTRHIKDEALALSTFFALHRPISVTQLVPKSVSNDVFAEIFSQRSHSVKDVLSTLSQTVETLENPQSQSELRNANGDREQQQYMQREATAAENKMARTIFERALPAHGQSDFLHLLDTMTGQFQPFTAPPPPQPITDADMKAATEDMAAADQQADHPHTRVYKALVTIEETVDDQGVAKVVAHSPVVLDEKAQQQPGRFLERMALRQLRYEDARARQMEEESRSMYTISVRRQRKLKMKKKKYKKLMRKTRNIRRKLDRL